MCLITQLLHPPLSRYVLLSSAINCLFAWCSCDFVFICVYFCIKAVVKSCLLTKLDRDGVCNCILQTVMQSLSRDGPKFGRRIPPNVWLGSARQRETIRPKFSQTSANIRRHWDFKLAAFCACRWR